MTKVVKNITCIGAGYVGGPTMAVIATKCPGITVTVADIDQKKIDLWNAPLNKNADGSIEGHLPIVEPGLEELVYETRGKNLFFSTDIKSAIERADIIFIAVGTPTKSIGSGAGKASHVGFVESAARSIAIYATHETVIVEKSTVPVGVSTYINQVLNHNSKTITNDQGEEVPMKFQILSNPEFLAEGTAIQDLYNPDRILIGHEKSPKGEEAAQLLASVYAQWVPEPSKRIIFTNVASSELTKLTANAFLAQRISSINAISAICELRNADVNEVSRAIGSDSRIGSKFLQASVGFGGSCFQKDVLNLSYIAESLGLHEVARYWQAVIDLNNYQRARFAKDVVHSLFDTLQGKHLCVLGFAFKANTGDTRESSSIAVIRLLLQEGAYIHIYDPKVTEKQIFEDLSYPELPRNMTMEELKLKTTVFNDPYHATKGCHALLVLTEWAQFKSYDYQQIYNEMEKPAFVFDGRNILDRQMLRSIGFTTHGIGVAPDQLN